MRRRGKGQHIVDDGRLAEQAFERRDRRLRPHHAALAFEAFEHGGLFAANIGAGAGAHGEREALARVLDVVAEPAARRRRIGDRLLHLGDGMGIFGADIDEALRRAGRDAGDGHAFDQREGIAFHQHAVGEGAAVAFIGIAADIFLIGLGVVHRLPFDAGREAGAAAAAQAGLGDVR